MMTDVISQSINLVFPVYIHTRARLPVLNAYSFLLFCFCFTKFLDTRFI